MALSSYTHGYLAQLTKQLTDTAKRIERFLRATRQAVRACPTRGALSGVASSEIVEPSTLRQCG